MENFPFNKTYLFTYPEIILGSRVTFGCFGEKLPSWPQGVACYQDVFPARCLLLPGRGEAGETTYVFFFLLLA